MKKIIPVLLIFVIGIGVLVATLWCSEKENVPPHPPTAEDRELVGRTSGENGSREASLCEENDSENRPEVNEGSQRKITGSKELPDATGNTNAGGKAKHRIIGKCYKAVGKTLILGRMDPENGFIPDVPEISIDLSQSAAVSIRYPVITDEVKPSVETITDKNGRVITVRTDPKTGKVQYEFSVTPK